MCSNVRSVNLSKASHVGSGMPTARASNVKSELVSEPGQFASIERTVDDSYQIDFQLRLRVPIPNSTIAEQAKINAELPAILPGLNAMVPTGQVSGFYNYIYIHITPWKHRRILL